MTAQDRRNVTEALSAAAELQFVNLAEALELTLLLADGDLEKYNRAALRWHVRFVQETKIVDIRESQAVLALLTAIPVNALAPLRLPSSSAAAVRAGESRGACQLVAGGVELFQRIHTEGVRKMKPRLTLAMAFTGLAALLHAGLASAGTVTLTNDTLTYAAVAGESNRVFVLGKLGGIRAIDTTASVTAGQGCVSLAAGEAFCAHKPSAVTSVILLGDMNDFVDLSTVGGGAVVSGGDGEDELGGAGGRTILDGGPGADTFHGGGSCRDVIDYSSRTNPVTVTIGDGLANDGESGEQDSIPATIGGVWGGHGNDAISYNGAVENCTQVDFSGRGGDDVLKARSFLSFLRGGAGDDTLTATVLASHLFGGPGDDVAIGGPGFQTFRGDEGDDDLDGRGGGDVLNGAEGVDRLLGGPGHDRLLGGPGPDTLLSRDDTTDRVVGGGGHDRARVDRRLDRIQSIEEFF